MSQFRFEPQREVTYETEEAQQEEKLRQARMRQEAAMRQEVAQRERAEQEQRYRLEEYKRELNLTLEKTLSGMGYYPPEPSGLLLNRTLRTLVADVQAHAADPTFATALAAVEQEIENRCSLSLGYLEQLRTGFAPPALAAQLYKELVAGVDKVIYKATVTMEMPQVNSVLAAKMAETELFLAKDWVQESARGVLAIHVDEENGLTILQIGVAAYGAIYVTIPAILRPQDRALKSIRETINRLTTFSSGVDPLAVINGSHQELNYNEIFLQSRVLRAPSGNTSRLTVNIQESGKRERLSADNTVILNSSPRNQEEYVRIFPEDTKARHWLAWGNEAQHWEEAVTANRFGTAPRVSQEALIDALSHSKNVIVVLAHCDGESIFMPEPPPRGSLVTADYLREHRAEIEANAPFVYLFSCKAGSLSNLRNFASTLLDCGASGVVASQSVLGGDDGRALLGRLLNEQRGAPPLEDYFKAMNDVEFREMEVFLG